MSDSLKILIAGGGTGGHLFPALAIGNELLERNPENKIHYVGSIFGIEANVLPEKNVDHTLLPIRGLQRGLDPGSIGKNTLLPARMVKSIMKTKKLFAEFQPDVVVGTGGYASALPIRRAVKSGIPTLIQEQNSYPGMTTRWFADKVDRVCIAFEEALEYIKKKTVSLPGILCGQNCKPETV